MCVFLQYILGAKKWEQNSIWSGGYRVDTPPGITWKMFEFTLWFKGIWNSLMLTISPRIALTTPQKLHTNSRPDLKVFFSPCWRSYVCRRAFLAYRRHSTLRGPCELSLPLICSSDVMFGPILYYCRTRLYRTFKGNRNWFDIARIRYIRTFIEGNQLGGRWKTVRYSRDSWYHEFKRFGQLQKNFKILLMKLIRNGPPNHATTGTYCILIEIRNEFFDLIGWEAVRT